MTTRAETEAEKVLRVPGITFADTPTGRMAWVIGSNHRVWQIIQWLQDSNRDEFKRAFDHVTDTQIDTAELYYSLYPEEIDRRIALERQCTLEKMQERFPNLIVIRATDT